MDMQKDRNIREEKTLRQRMEDALEGEFDTDVLYAMYDMIAEKFVSGFFSPTDNPQSAVTIILEIMDNNMLDIEKMYMVPMHNSTTGNFAEAISVKKLVSGIM